MIPILLQVEEVRNFHSHFTDEGTERELEWFSQSQIFGGRKRIWNQVPTPTLTTQPTVRQEWWGSPGRGNLPNALGKVWVTAIRRTPYAAAAAAAAAKSLQSCLTLCDPIEAAHQAPPSLRFSRQEHWSGLPFPSPMHESEKWKWSRSVVSDSSRPHWLQPTRLLHLWDFSGKSTGTGCHRLLWKPLYVM